ncbi:HPr family phosphocarrier protein [Cohnella thailandensis]|jgi:Phosphotransferase system, HPr-related proteins|uniref:HPr family phosphocarrier protein n=1 Tax=Cohnella thailandensis TaxID=557557 RepID=A0A841SWZ3_9BACL|nr:HPr family phosphocarrier protein [Cohnella thailandensis]MBB6636434.1 HPr family phosphocarrier protein [Cohnella thailandensis]MBP1973595.1 phosphocarrier protein [Cohnella thailandensis]
MSNNNAAIVELSQTANKYRSSIVLQAENKYIDVKSILGLFTTLVGGHAYELHVHGPDAEEAKAELATVFAKHNLNVTIVD